MRQRIKIGLGIERYELENKIVTIRNKILKSIKRKLSYEIIKTINYTEIHLLFKLI